MFCAPSRMLVLSTALETSLSAVNGGQTTISTSLMLTSSRLRPVTRSSASATVLFIFQLPAMISLRDLSTSQRLWVVQRRHAGQFLPFQKFQAGAAAGAHESDPVGQPGQVQRLDAVATADDALGAFLRRVRHGARHGERAFGETLVFEHAHGPVPQERTGLGNDFGEHPDGLWPDIHAFLPVRDVHTV